MYKFGLAAVLSVSILISSCGNSAPQSGKAIPPKSPIMQGEAASRVTIHDRTPKTIFKKEVKDPEVLIEKWDIDLSNVKPLEEIVYASQNTLFAQGNKTITKTVYEPAESFTKKYVKDTEQRRVGPQYIEINVAGEYNLQVSASGDIRVVKVSAGGSIKVSASGKYSSTKYSCSYFETQVTERYIRFKQYNYFSDGTKAATGAYTDEKQPSGPNDIITRQIGNWTIC
jgi:hypothetical protein